jgi:hypothetical protein
MLGLHINIFEHVQNNSMPALCQEKLGNFKKSDSKVVLKEKCGSAEGIEGPVFFNYPFTKFTHPIPQYLRYFPSMETTIPNPQRGTGPWVCHKDVGSAPVVMRYVPQKIPATIIKPPTVLINPLPCLCRFLILGWTRGRSS